MRATVVIPVWNGEAVIGKCLTAVFQHSGQHLQSVICVENHSQDGSRRLIEAQFPQVTLLSQPVNLGFAGGVNAGLCAANSDLLILLNQDCLVQPGWLEALVRAVQANESLGIVGGRILHADQTVNHAGAYLERPLAYGRHRTDNDEQPLEYVTGALFAITLRAWQTIGPFDEGFYPAYFEETDYCFRARRLGFEIGYVPEATVVHLFNNKSWQTDPIRHNINQHAMRYRFIAKHYSLPELQAFFPAEGQAMGTEIYYEQAVGRLLGLRRLLRDLTAVHDVRTDHLESPRTPEEERTLAIGFEALLAQAMDSAVSTGMKRQPLPPAADDDLWQETWQRLKALQHQEHDLLARIYFIAPEAAGNEPGWRRWLRLLVLRPFSFLIGRDYYLMSQLNTIHVARLDQLTKLQRLIERRLALLETVTRYEQG